MLTLSSDDPADVGELLEHFLLHEPRWSFVHDDADRAFKIRSLLPPNVRFPHAADRTFALQDVFTHARTVSVGTHDARDILMLSLLSSAYLDGTLPGRSLFCVYPSSTAGKVSPQLAGFLERAKAMVGSYYKEDLLERVAQAPDTSLERWKRSTGRASTADTRSPPKPACQRRGSAHPRSRGEDVTYLKEETRQAGRPPGSASSQPGAADGSQPSPPRKSPSPPDPRTRSG